MKFPPRPVLSDKDNLPRPPAMPVLGEFTDNLDLFQADQKSGYNVDQFNYNFAILDQKYGELSSGGGGTNLEIVGGDHIDVVADGSKRVINYVETWKPKILPIKK